MGLIQQQKCSCLFFVPLTLRNSQKQPTRFRRHASPKSWSRKKHQDWAPSISRIHCNENLGLVTRNSTSLIDEGFFFWGGAHIFKPLGVTVLAMEFGPQFCSHNLPTVTLKLLQVSTTLPKQHI